MNKAAIFLAGNISEGFAARGPYPDTDTACIDNDGEEGWVMETSRKLPTQVVVLRIDNTPAEDRICTIGCFRIPTNRVAEFEQDVQDVRNDLLATRGDDYEDQDLVEALLEHGWENEETLVELTVK